MKDTIDAAHDAKEHIDSKIEILQQHAEAANMLGFTALAKHLWSIAVDLEWATDKLYQAWKDEQANAIGCASEGSNNMIRAALAVCELKEGA